MLVLIFFCFANMFYLCQSLGDDNRPHYISLRQTNALKIRRHCIGSKPLVLTVCIIEI